MKFPDVSNPEVSIVMVTYNGWRHTARALAALAERTSPLYEVIVVDNGSSDDTVAGLTSLEGARVMRNSRNLGFGPACNLGAAVARSRYLMLLNNDTQVGPGWLEPLLEVADASSDVAAVAPQLTYPDGRLQEAGSIVWRNGRVRNYGDGDVPERPHYLFRRTVDYASAAALLIRRSAFSAVGGFDSMYAPAYCEDVDLCLTFSTRGWRVVYQPQSRVVHVRGASTNTRQRRRLLERNRARLRSRWRPFLDRRPPESWYAEPSAVLGGRDAMTCERVLVLTAGLPARDGYEKTGSLFAFLTAAAARWPNARWTVAALDSAGGTQPRALGDAGIEAICGESTWLGWLHDRRFHYGHVLVSENRWRVGELGAALRQSQPQAPLVSLGDKGADLNVEDDVSDSTWARALGLNRG